MQSWTTNQFAPGSKFYTLYNATTGQFDDIVSNTSNTLTLAHPVSGQPWKKGDTYYISGTTLYYKGTIETVTITGGALIVTDRDSPGWTTNQWWDNGDTYSLVDTTQLPSGYFSDVGYEITDNGSNTITSTWYGYNNKNQITPAAGDGYVILRASVCMDQATRGAGVLLSSPGFGTPVSPLGPVNQTIHPLYEWMDTTNFPPPYGVVAPGTNKLIANRDWYNESVNQSAQTSSTSPFSGTLSPAVGHGTLANRPSTCTQGAAYWATDQSSWNQSGNGFGQGELFVCTAPDTWALKYRPFTYPHPLVTGGSSGFSASLPSPPTGLTAIVQ
jgi:hypothetical protein